MSGIDGSGIRPRNHPQATPVLGAELGDIGVHTVAAIGFTVSLFVAGVAFPPGQIQDAAKMGALFSFAATAIAIVTGKIAGVERRDLPVAAPVVSG